MNIGSKVVKGVTSFAVGNSVVAEIADLALVLSVVSRNTSVTGVISGVAASAGATNDKQIASDTLVVEEEESDAAGRAGDCGCSVICSRAGRTSCYSAVAGRALSSLRVSEVAWKADVACIVAVVAGGAACDELATIDTGVALGEEVSEALAAHHIEAGVVSGVTGGAVGD